jgi:hypothetical protein
VGNRSGLRNQDSIPSVGSFYLLRAQTGSEIQPPCCPVSTWGLYFVRTKQPDHAAQHSLNCSAEVENAWSCTSFLQSCYDMVLN